MQPPQFLHQYPFTFLCLLLFQFWDVAMWVMNGYYYNIIYIIIFYFFILILKFPKSLITVSFPCLYDYII